MEKPPPWIRFTNPSNSICNSFGANSTIIINQLLFATSYRWFTRCTLNNFIYFGISKPFSFHMMISESFLNNRLWISKSTCSSNIYLTITF